jgi:Ca-activated chloride channel family protein
MKSRKMSRVFKGMAVCATAMAGFWVAPVSVPAHEAAGDEVRCIAELDRAILPANGATRAVVRVSLEAPHASLRNRPPVNLALVLDRSGSMSGDKLRRMQDAAMEAVRRLDARDICSVVAYNHEVETVVGAQHATALEDIERRIRQFNADGNTALFAGVSQGANELRRNLSEQNINRIVLLSDGCANVGPSSPDDLGRLGAAFAKEGISVSTVGVGSDYNEDLMARLSQAGDGNTYFVESTADLPRIFAAEIGEVLNVVAQDVVIEVVCPAGVRPLRIIGRDGRIDGRRVEVTLNQLYGGQSRFVLVEVEIDGTREGESRDVAQASCRYLNALTQRRAQQQSVARATFSRDERKVEESINIKVKRDVVANEVAVAREQAIVLSDKGQKKEAAATLRASASMMQRIADTLRLPDMAKDADEVLQEAEVADTAGIKGAERKRMRTDSYQIINQQNTK